MQVHVYHTDAEDLKTVLYRTCTARPERTHVWGMFPSLLDEAWINNDVALRPLPCLKAKALSHMFISSQFTLRSAVCR